AQNETLWHQRHRDRLIEGAQHTVRTRVGALEAVALQEGDAARIIIAEAHTQPNGLAPFLPDLATAIKRPCDDSLFQIRGLPLRVNEKQDGPTCAPQHGKPCQAAASILPLARVALRVERVSL